MSDLPTGPGASEGSRWEDLLDAFVSPVELFSRRRDGKFGHGLLALVVLTGILYFATRSAMQPIYEAEFVRGMAANPNVTPEQLEMARTISGRFGPIMLLVGLPIAVFVVAAVIWLAGRLVGGRLSYPQAAAISTFAFFPRMVESIVSGAQALLMDEGKLTSRFSVSLGIGRFLDPAQTNVMLLALLGRLDLFTLWVTALIAVGLKQMTGLTTGKAVAGAAVVWLIGALPVLYQAFRTA